MRAVILVAPDADPLRRVAGLGLLRRAVLTAQSWGAGQVFALACGDKSAPGAAGAEVATALPEPEEDEDLLILSATTVYDRRTGAALSGPPCGAACRAGGAVRIHASVARRLDLGGVADPKEAVACLGRLGIEVEERRGDFFHQPVADDADARRAEHLLFESCRKPVDGIVSRYINRNASLFLSRRLSGTRVHPNHVSMLCIALGAVAALMVLGGGYAWVLAGAAVFQLNSILDGVDGELARVRFQQSKLGELLDSVGDNLSNFAYFSALAWVAAREGHGVLALLGGTGLALWAVYLVFLYSELYGIRRGDVLLVTEAGACSPGPLRWLVRLGRTVLRRDSFVMLALLLAVAGRACWMLPVMLVGGASVFSYAAVRWARALARLLRPPLSFES